MAEFQLDKRLSNDTVRLASWPLCEVLLMNDSQYPWVILVPRKLGAREIYELSAQEQLKLLQESTFLGQTLMTIFSGTKLNVAALGNVVSQLHVHHIVRFDSDACWPAPVWGKFPVKPYDEAALRAVQARLKPIMDKCWQD